MRTFRWFFDYLFWSEGGVKGEVVGVVWFGWLVLCEGFCGVVGPWDVGRKKKRG